MKNNKDLYESGTERLIPTVCMLAIYYNKSKYAEDLKANMQVFKMYL
jgi:hypothetical protein